MSIERKVDFNGASMTGYHCKADWLSKRMLGAAELNEKAYGTRHFVVASQVTFDKLQPEVVQISATARAQQTDPIIITTTGGQYRLNSTSGALNFMKNPKASLTRNPDELEDDIPNVLDY